MKVLWKWMMLFICISFCLWFNIIMMFSFVESQNIDRKFEIHSWSFLFDFLSTDSHLHQKSISELIIYLTCSRVKYFNTSLKNLTMHNKYKKCHANKFSEFVWPYMFLKNKTFATIAKMVVVFSKTLQQNMKPVLFHQIAEMK